MNGFRSIIVTILLVVMAIQMVLPIYSHHGFNAAGWRAYDVLEIGQHGNSAPELRTTALSIDKGNKPAFFVVVQSTGESPLLSGLPFLWARNEIRFELFEPHPWIFSLPTSPHKEIDLPPEGIPPRPAPAIPKL
jgi:hypothetical protein